MVKTQTHLFLKVLDSLWERLGNENWAPDGFWGDFQWGARLVTIGGRLVIFGGTSLTFWGVIIISILPLKVLDSLRERLGNESRAKMEELLKEGFSQDQVVHLMLTLVLVLVLMSMLVLMMMLMLSGVEI